MDKPSCLLVNLDISYNNIHVYLQSNSTATLTSKATKLEPIISTLLILKVLHIYSLKFIE